VASQSKIEQAEDNIAVLQAALDDAQRVLHAADQAQKRAQAKAEKLRTVAVGIAVVSIVVISILSMRHRRLKRAHRTSENAQAA
jgi:hypothetical protein